jgi:hypothetical protein
MTIFLSHFWALVWKRVNYFKRDIQGLACEIFLPCLIVLGGFAILTISFVVDSPSAPISLSEYSEYLPTPSLIGYSSSAAKADATSLVSKFNQD